MIRAALTAQVEAGEWAGGGVGGAAAGSVAAALPTARTGEPAGCCCRRGFGASGCGLAVSELDLSQWLEADATLPLSGRQRDGVVKLSVFGRLYTRRLVRSVALPYETFADHSCTTNIPATCATSSFITLFFHGEAQP